MPSYDRRNDYRATHSMSVPDIVMICLSLKWPYSAIRGNCKDIQRLSTYNSNEQTEQSYDRQIIKNTAAVIGSAGAGLLGVATGIATAGLIIGAAANPLAAIPGSVMAYFVVANLVSYTAANLVEGIKILTGTHFEPGSGGAATQQAYNQAGDEPYQAQHITNSGDNIGPDGEPPQDGNHNIGLTDSTRSQQQRSLNRFSRWFSCISEDGRLPDSLQL